MYWLATLLSKILKKNKGEHMINSYPERVDLSPNCGGHIAPNYIILHHSGGSFLGGVSWIKQIKSQVSYHYMIDEDGSRVQLVYDSLRAWHAGKSSWNGINEMNSHSIGISFWGDTHKRELSFEEVDSCAEKCLYLMDKFAIPVGNILSHKQVSPGRKDDPSDEAMSKVIARVREYIKYRE